MVAEGFTIFRDENWELGIENWELGMEDFSTERDASTILITPNSKLLTAYLHPKSFNNGTTR